MGINSLAGHFFEITDVVFSFVQWIARSAVPFARSCAFVFARVQNAGLRAWGHGLALFAALVHRRPGPCNARDALGADGSRREL